MSIVAHQNQSWISDYSKHNLPGDEHQWLRQQRRTGLDNFVQLGLPGIRDEQWRYTNLRSLKNHSYEFSTPNHEHIGDSNLNLASTNNARLVMINGHYSAAHSNLSVDPQINQSDDANSASLTSLARVLDQQAQTPATALMQQLETHYGSTLPSKLHGFIELNSAYAADGYVLHLPKDCVIDRPLEVLFISTLTNKSEPYPLSHTRNLIIAQTNSKCQIIERHIGSNGQVYLNNTITEIISADGAHIDHIKLCDESDQGFHIGGVFCRQAAHSNLKVHNFILGGLVTRHDVHTDLMDQACDIQMNGLILGKGRMHADNHTQVNHAKPNCRSDELYKVILEDKSRSVFRGRIIVAQDAQLTSADQQNNNLLLSDLAEADCKPQLEIYADDVKCSHGATVGQLDPKALFYLHSRGIDQTTAKSLLTYAFANEVVARIDNDELRDEVSDLIATHLHSDTQ